MLRLHTEDKIIDVTGNLLLENSEPGNRDAAHMCTNSIIQLFTNILFLASE